MDNNIEYRIVGEYSAPDYIDVESGEKLWESCQADTQGYWVIAYNTETEKIEEWLENLPTLEQAEKYLADLKADLVINWKKLALSAIALLETEQENNINYRVETGEIKLPTENYDKHLDLKINEYLLRYLPLTNKQLTAIRKEK